MKDLSVSQSYLICALNKYGKLPSLSLESPVCLLAGGLIDLIFAKCIIVGEDNKLYVINDLTEEHQYLNSLYTFIKNSKPLKIEKLASEYTFTFSDKHIKLLIKDIGASLVSLGYATANNVGLLRKTACFIPNTKIIDNIIQNIRAELLENGAVSDNTIALVSLMDKDKQIKKYFSTYEKDELKLRLKQIKDSDSNKLVKKMIDYIEMMVFAVIVSSTAD